MCVKNDIAINKCKFRFCLDNIEFAGFLIIPNGILPYPKIVAAIKDFPVTKDITSAPSWFGLVNQIVWASAQLCSQHKI